MKILKRSEEEKPLLRRLKNIGMASKKLYRNTLKEDEPRLIYTYPYANIGALSRITALIGMRALNETGALNKKNTFEGARLLERGLLLEGRR